MKNRQLMRLNKVLHKGEVKTVDCISPGYVSFLEDRHGEDKWGKWIDLDEVEFIPLDKENLIPLGFEFCNGRFGEYYKNIRSSLLRLWYFDDGQNEYWMLGKKVEGANDYNTVVLSSRVSNIHQLQNIYFALTGEELEHNVI